MSEAETAPEAAPEEPAVAVDPEVARQREEAIKAATAEQRLIDDTAALLRKIVDFMPQTTWLREAQQVIETTEGLSEKQVKRRETILEEVADARADAAKIVADWIVGWYERDAVFVAKDGAVESFRAFIAEQAPETVGVEPGKLRDTLLPKAPAIAVEMIHHAHFVVSHAMKFGLLDPLG